MTDHSKIVQTYEPDNCLKKGYGALFTEIAREIAENRWLTWQLFKRDFVTMYKQSFIGIIWIFILPIVNVCTFLLLSRSGIFNIGDIPVAYPIYAILGMAFWQIFATGMISCGNSLSSAGEMIMRINFSKKALVLAAVGKPIISFSIQFILVIVLFVIYQTKPSAGIFLAPLVIVPVILLTLGLGFIMALLNAIVRDTGSLLSIGMMLLMYLTPVLYAKPSTGLLAAATQLNPMYYFISAGRDLILTGTVHELKGFIISSILSLVIFVIGLLIFHLTETRIAERV